MRTFTQYIQKSPETPIKFSQYDVISESDNYTGP